MSIKKPFFRVYRPIINSDENIVMNHGYDYVLDTRFSSDRIQLSRAYLNIEGKLKEIFDYIEPDEDNKNIFSFELYSLFLRTCTEIELNCKKILISNGYNKKNVNKFNMCDYS